MIWTIFSINAEFHCLAFLICISSKKFILSIHKGDYGKTNKLNREERKKQTKMVLNFQHMN